MFAQVADQAHDVLGHEPADSAVLEGFGLGDLDTATLQQYRQEFYARAHDPKELVVIDGADHLFDGKVLEVGDAIEDLLGDWLS